MQSTDQKRMRIVVDFPPNFQLIQAALPNASREHTYCYGDTIYNPSGKEIPPDIEHHELIHSRKQGDNPDAWWYSYLTDRRFRLTEELEAYGEQYRWAKENVKAPNSFFKWLRGNMALALSGEAYGNLMSYGEAESAIRNYGKTTKEE